MPWRQILILGLLLLPAAAGCRCESRGAAAPALSKFEYVRPKMGTGFRLVLYTTDQPTADVAADAAFARIDELNAALSDYDPQSELSRLCQLTDAGPMTRPASVGPDLWHMLARSAEAARLSDGAFDITVSPFVRLWRRSRDLKQLPTPQRLAEARKSVGFANVRLDPASRGVTLLATKMRLDVGGIAKGYAADEALKILRHRGIARAAVGAAGDLAVGDPPPGKDHWVVAIQALDQPEASAGHVRLKNAAVSTAGDTYRVVEIDGKRYSHIIDPATGLGLTRRTGATVIAPDGTTADWLDTAVCVLGPEKGMALIERTAGTAVRITTIGGDAPDAPPTLLESAGFRHFHVDPAGNPETRAAD